MVNKFDFVLFLLTLFVLKVKSNDKSCVDMDACLSKSFDDYFKDFDKKCDQYKSEYLQKEYLVKHRLHITTAALSKKLVPIIESDCAKSLMDTIETYLHPLWIYDKCNMESEEDIPIMELLDEVGDSLEVPPEEFCENLVRISKFTCDNYLKKSEIMDKCDLDKMLIEEFNSGYKNCSEDNEQLL